VLLKLEGVSPSVEISLRHRNESAVISEKIRRVGFPSG